MSTLAWHFAAEAGPSDEGLLTAYEDPLYALVYARGPVIHRVECGGVVGREPNGRRLVCTEHKTLWTADADPMLREWGGGKSWYENSANITAMYWGKRVSELSAELERRLLELEVKP